MKRLLLISITILLFSCSKTDEPCECTGKFVIETGSQLPFFIKNVDCKTGSPYIEEQPNHGNPATFLGCKD